MALPKEWPPMEITIPFKEWQKMSDTILTIRSFAGVKDEYSKIKCPRCGLNMWTEDDGKISCVACKCEFMLCICGEVLTEDKKSPYEPTWCVKCRKDWALSNSICPECEKDLVPDENDPRKMHCEDGCIDPVEI